MGGGVNVLAGSQDTKIAIDAGGVSGREIGGGGNITITANANNVSSSSNVSSPGNIIITGKISSTAFTTIGEKPAGNVSLTANGGMVSTGDIDVSQIQDDRGFGGIPGNITIKARELNLSDATYSTSVKNKVDNTVGQNLRGGNVHIEAQDITLDNAQIFTSVDKDAVGKGGNIEIVKSGSLTLNNGAQLQAQTSGFGNAGNVHIEAQDITLDDAFINSNVASTGKGDGGDIEIVKSGSLTLNNGAQLQAQTSGFGNAGNVHIEAQDINLDNAQIFTSVENGGSGKGGNVEVVKSGSLTLRNGAQLEAQTSGSGDAGNIQVNTSNRVEVTGFNSNGLSSAFFTSSKPTGGKGGNISVTTPHLRISDGAGLDARTETGQPGGNVIINAGTFEALNGGEVITTASSGGKAGDITLNIANQVTLSGSDATFDARKKQFGTAVLTVDSASGLFANTEQKSSGIGGSITITPQLGTKPTVFIRDGAKISVNSQGTGDGGNIEITTPRRITLDNHSSVTANSENGNGGNITIDPDILLLRRGSQISTTSGTKESGGGNGGNIKITADFLVGVLSENSDIVANAFNGKGGEIEINANKVLGFVQAPPRTLDTPFSDIAASSKFGINGIVILNTLNLDPSQGLEELNLVPIDTSQLIAQGCATGKRFTLNENKFVVTGRSGIPASPEDVFRSSRVLTELDTPTVTNNLANSPATPATTTPQTSPHPIIEAQGWIVAPNGKIRLVAQSTNPIASPLQQNPITCPADSSPVKP